jgi:ABC-2 type transport system ATP-binding protein
VKYEPVRDENTLSLTLKTDGSVAGVAELFTKIREAHIEVTEFSQKTPTLDDAFLKIINEHEEKK